MVVADHKHVLLTTTPRAYFDIVELYQLIRRRTEEPLSEWAGRFSFPFVERQCIHDETKRATSSGRFDQWNSREVASFVVVVLR